MISSVCVCPFFVGTQTNRPHPNEAHVQSLPSGRFFSSRRTSCYIFYRFPWQDQLVISPLHTVNCGSDSPICVRWWNCLLLSFFFSLTPTNFIRPRLCERRGSASVWLMVAAVSFFFLKTTYGRHLSFWTVECASAEEVRIFHRRLLDICFCKVSVVAQSRAITT